MSRGSLVLKASFQSRRSTEQHGLQDTRRDCRKFYAQNGKGFGRNQKAGKKDTSQESKFGRKANRERVWQVQDNSQKEEQLPFSRPIHNADVASKMRGILLVGFAQRDAEQVRDWLTDIEEGLVIACCWDDHLDRTVDDLFSAPHGVLSSALLWREPAESVPRAVIFSGMSQKEMLGIAEFWNLSGVQEPIFASAVPAVQSRQLRDVLREVVDAYAQNLDSGKANLDSASLRDVLRKKVAANKQ